MGEKIFAKDEWKEVLAGLKDAYRMFVPVREGDYHIFGPLEEGVDPDFDFQNTRLSPKSLIQPQSERMFEYSLDEGNEEAHILKESRKDYSPRAVVGIRPCDALALQLVRINFDNPEYRDPWWVGYFESTTFVGLGCNDPCATCFCTSVGGDPFGEEGMDVLLHDLGDRFLAKSLTEKGEALMGKMAGGTAGEENALKEAETIAASAREKIRSKVPTDQLKQKAVNDLFDAPFWEEVAFPCINCGTCTFLCPTCWCFDIQDEILGKEGDRIRNWDACMFPLFTLHGSGHNPRDKKAPRVRQRFMHKLKYYVDKYGNGVACVGCGRCVQACPVNIDIRDVFVLMNEYG
ncbi:MAG: 4Fe-4S dicluster domain-containing protein [Deltaproteobacteria bacterium]|nr:4Fe-4S dicluster domain-containing protein [Deltaproteobacteria bacterium]MBW2206703.1 4Fe-4S dicluster domain-containing protein [Deltaproteobacteria bacterium]